MDQEEHADDCSQLAMAVEMSTKNHANEFRVHSIENGGTSESKQDSESVRRLKNFGDNSSFSAAVYEFKSKSWCKRLLWLLIVLTATGGFCYVTYKSIAELVDSPIQTSITQERMLSLEFPAVTICSLSLLNTTKLNTLSSTFNYREKLITLFGTASSDFATCQSAAGEIKQELQNGGSNYGFSDLIGNISGNHISELLKSCTFIGTDCSFQDFSTITTVSGNCFTFNGPTTETAHTVSGTGPRQGLRLQLENGEQLFSLNKNYGYSVIIHNRNEPPRPESQGIFVGLDSVLYIGMREVISIDKTVYYSNRRCIKESESTSDANLMLDIPNYPDYSSSLCLNNCFYSHIANACGCIEKGFYNHHSNDIRSCDAVDLCCEIKSFDTFKDNCTCRPNCTTTERTLTASSASSESNGRVGINVYYETVTSETRETTDSYTPISLINDIGGATGLFLGFTLLTVGEVVLLVLALFTDLCCSSCKERGRRRKQTQAI